MDITIDAKVKNNILSENGSFEIYANDDNATINNNVVYHSTAEVFMRWNSINYDESEWDDYKTASGATNSVYGDPKFDNATGSVFTLQSSSPAKSGASTDDISANRLTKESVWTESVDLLSYPASIGAYGWRGGGVPLMLVYLNQLIGE